jgi:hypothetical protein
MLSLLTLLSPLALLTLLVLLTLPTLPTQGLNELTDCIEGEQRMRASLTANSRITGEGNIWEEGEEG